MLTVIETSEFQKQAARIWRDDEREAFIDWIAAHPTAGDVIPASGGARKVRWSRPGMGKRGGARVVYFHLAQSGALLLIAVYAKAERATLPGREIKRS